MDDSEIQLLDRLESRHWWYVARKIILKKWISTLVPKSRILDFGSASGANSQFIRSLGFECASIEFSAVGVSIQRSKGLEVTQGDARSLPYVSDLFDAIICLDVMEHIVEDYAVANEIHRVLRQGGRFLISVPHCKNLCSAHDIAVNHLRRYETEELLKVLQEAGLKVVTIWGTNSFLKPIIFSVKGIKKGSNLKKSGKLENATFFLLTSLEEKFFSHKFRVKHGVTLWVTGEKP